MTVIIMRMIGVKEQAHKEAKQVCKIFDLTLGDFVHHSAVYFRRTGIDPGKSDLESPQKAIKELEKRVGQVVAYIKNQEQEKLNPLLEQMIVLSRKLDESLKKLPASERFDQVIKGVNHHANLLVENHKKQMDLLRESNQKISDENRRELKALTEALRNVQAEQKAIKEAIDTKLSKKVFG